MSKFYNFEIYLKRKYNRHQSLRGFVFVMCELCPLYYCPYFLMGQDIYSYLLFIGNAGARSRWYFHYKPLRWSAFSLRCPNVGKTTRFQVLPKSTPSLIRPLAAIRFPPPIGPIKMLRAERVLMRSGRHPFHLIYDTMPIRSISF